MKDRMIITHVRPVNTIADVVENVNALVAAIYAPPTSSYAKLPRQPDDDECLTIPGVWWR